MSKMFFTFKWGKGTLVTIEDLKKILLKYYTKEEVDEILKQYATNEAVAGELALKLDISEFEKFKSNLQVELDEKAEQVWVEQEVERLDGEITEIKNNAEQAGELVGGLISNLDGRVTTNTENIAANTSKITSNKQLLDELIEQFKTAKIVVIQGPYSATKTYRLGDVVVSEVVSDKNLYLSLADNNTGNPLTDTTKWKNLGEANEVNLEDYYNKMQVDGLLANKVNTSDLNNYAKLNANNTYASNKRNIFNTLPEVYTQSTLPTKNTDLTTKKYVDDKVNSDITPSSVTLGSGTSGADGVKVTPSRIDINGSTDIYFNSPNQTSQIYGTVVIDSGDIWRYSAPSNDYSVVNKTYVDNKFTTPDYVNSKINSFIKSKKVYWSSWSRVNESEHSGYYNATFNYSNNEWANKTVFSIRIHCKNNTYSIQYGFQQNGSWIDLFIAGNRGFYDNMDYIELFYF